MQALRDRDRPREAKPAVEADRGGRPKRRYLRCVREKKGDDAYGEWGESERRNDMDRAGSKLLDGV